MMINKAAKYTSLFYLLIILFLAGCQSGDTAAASDKGKILLWHGWSEAEAETLSGILHKFDEIYPNLSVISQAVAADELRQRYEQAARLGLGPDLFIGPGEWLVPLADQGLIQDLRPFAPRTEDYLSGAVGSLTYADGLYGLPLALRPVALYYNTKLVETPAATLDEWLVQAAAGKPVALNTNFWPAFWGIQAFGGQLFDEAGRVILDQGGFANWLSWLKNARVVPGVIFSRDNDSLRDLFFSGKVAYYTGSPDDLAAARAALGDDTVAVTMLPAGPNGPSGPLLDVEAIYFNQAAPPQKTRQTLLLAAFLTNASQSTTLMREIGRVPANRTVQVDPRLHPAEAGFAAQARTAVAIPNLPQTALLLSRGDDIYRAVLEGVLDVTEATLLLTDEVNDAFGYASLDAPQAVCQAVGSLMIWQPWEDRLAEALQQSAADYMRLCPDVIVEVNERPFEQIAALYSQASANPDQNNQPDLILGPGRWLTPFVAAQSIQPLSGQISAEMRQRFVPAALSTVEVADDLYGIPYWLETDVLYYNSQMVSDPPVTLAELRQKASEGKKVALFIDFRHAYWGAAAFGAQLFSPVYRLSLVETGFSDWLAWLQQAQREPNILLVDDMAVGQAAFVAGEVALLVGPASLLGALEAQMPADTLRVTRLPAGPQGEAHPWLQTAAFFLTADLSVEQQALALAFIEFATNNTNQTALMTQTRLMPVNVNINTEDAPIISGFLQSVNTAYFPPNIPQITAVLLNGHRVYADILTGETDPLAAACEFTRLVDAANNFSIAPADLPPDCQAAP
ncbi:MAG: extracellular solute-binding protein [Anaerolinea sp.]|nr:extracellular solute-binding protein [Anaerolinea sp.]